MRWTGIEGFARVIPRGLWIAWVSCTLGNFDVALLVGKMTCFRRDEFFGVTLRLVGRMSIRARPWDAAFPARPGSLRCRSRQSPAHR
jgi:hypothetical protein